MLFIAVMLAAVLFDLSNAKTSVAVADSHNASGSQSHQVSQFCFYSSFGSFKLKGASEESADLSVFLKKQSRFLQQYHHLKASQLARFEPLSQYRPSDLLVHFIQMRKYLYRSSDDSSLPLS